MTQTTAPFVGLGSTFAFATVAAPTVFTTLAGVISIAQSGDKVTTDKTTNMQSVNGVDTYIAGTQEPGTFDVKGQLLPADASQVALNGIRDAKLPVNFLVNYAGGSQRAFSGIVESITPSVTLDKVSTVDIKIKVTGPVTEELS
jgi:hypothetical protein